LSLSNEPDKLANMALDTLAQVLNIDCCWIQTISDRKHKKLFLAAERGFSPEMQQEIATMDLSHSFSEQIIGLGHQIIIPDLSHDGLYGIPSFKNTGYKWLVAVPLMTYRVHGILGTASRNRKLLKKDTADLIMTIAGLIATALSKANLTQPAPAPDKHAGEPALQVKEELKTPAIKASREPLKEIKKEHKAPEKKAEEPVHAKSVNIPPPNKPTRRPDGAFHSHAHKMEIFRKSHK
jgi:signal transduction protein with GAF and PtsI domain